MAEVRCVHGLDARFCSICNKRRPGAATKLPTGYGKHEMHPALLRTADIITSGIELTKRLSAWRAARQD